MTIEIHGVEELIASIKQGGDRAKKHVIEEMRKVGAEIQAKARAYAPIDKGDLEQAIKVRDEGGGRDYFGRFERKSIEVYIDLEMESSDGSGHTLADYAYEMHEHLTPYGSLKLGPKSSLKQAASGLLVGGGFLDRAVDEISGTLVARLAKRARAAL